jgi:hypothetical protein
MKILIWFGCIFMLSLITVLLKYAGVLLGFIPTFILGSLMFWTARTLCKKWDIYKQNKKKKKEIFMADGVKQIDKKESKKCILPLINIIVLIFPILFSSIILLDGTYIDELYFLVVISGAFTVILEILKLKILKNNLLVSILLIISSGIMFVPVLTSDLWEEDVVIATSICIASVYVLFGEAYKLLVVKYYDTHRYRMKCYKKVADMQSYLEKGIITQEEFEKNKKDILKKIKIETTNTKKIGEEKTKSVDTKGPAPSVGDDVFRGKVETVKIGEPSDEEWEYLYKTDFEKFWEKVLDEYDLSKLPDKIMSLRDDTMIYGEEAREVYLSRLKGVVEYSEWMTKNHPEVINNQWNTIKELKKELQEKTSGELYMLDVIRNYEDKYIRY